jgi:serine/threonine protein kinase HipA of HipAB toxin-antitoxin module
VLTNRYLREVQREATVARVQIKHAARDWAVQRLEELGSDAPSYAQLVREGIEQVDRGRILRECALRVASLSSPEKVARDIELEMEPLDPEDDFDFPFPQAQLLAA